MSEDSSQRRPIATWNRARGVWETTQTALCGHSEPFSETWPASGMTHGGQAFELPTPGHHTDGSASSLLPTPVADHSRGLPQPGTDYQSLPNVAATLLSTPTSRDGKGANQRGDDSCLHGALLPTPRATDGTKGGPNQRGSSGDMMLPSAVQLLPTLTAQAAKHEADDRGRGTPDDVNLWSIAARIGATTQPPSTDGNAPSDE